MRFSTTVQVVLAGTQPPRPLPELKVALYDSDRYSSDDLLGTSTTDGTGRARFTYTQADFADNGIFDDPRPGVPFGSLRPDLYAVVYAETDDTKVAFSTRSRVIADSHRRDILVAIPQTVAEAHGLIKKKPRATQEQKQQDFDARLRRLVADGGPEVLCWSDLVLETLAGLQNPTNEFQQQAAKAVKDAKLDLDTDTLDRLTKLAHRSRKMLATSEFGGARDCPDPGDIEGFAKYAISDLGPLAGLGQALQTATPPPDANLPDPKPGVPFAGQWTGWPDDKPLTCTWRYKQGILAAPATAQWDEYFPGAIAVMQPPSVNTITVWSDRFGIGVNEREADVASKVLRFRTPDFTKGSVGWRIGDREMSVDLSSDTCLIARADSADDNRQILVVDVLPGQKVALRGSGFISNTAELRAHHFPWESDIVDADGILQPDDANMSAVVGWDQTQVEVHGSGDPPQSWQLPTSYDKDLIVFDWPEEARNPGLYRLTFEFDNPEGKTVRIGIDQGTCELDFDTRAITADLWFVVLPALAPVRARVRADRVQCLALTHPQWWPDSLGYSALGSVQTFSIPLGTSEPAQSNTARDDKVFFQPATWSPAPALQPIPSGTASPPVLQPHDIIIVRLSADEVVSDLDKGFLTILAILTAIVVAVILVVLVIAITALLASIIGFTMGAATPLLVPIIGGLMAGVLLGLSAAVGGIYLSIPTIDHIGEVNTAVQGIELAHILSGARYHRMLFTDQRPDPGLTAELVSSSVVTGALKERYRCSAFGGTYILDLSVEPTIGI